MKKRLFRLEQHFKPQTSRPPLKIIIRPFKDEDVADAGAVMIMPRPGDTSPDTLIINVVEVPSHKGPDIEAEPDGVELPGAVAELEASLTAKRGRR